MNKTDGKYIIIPDRRDAIKEAIVNAEEGDVILVLGKGHIKKLMGLDILLMKELYFVR